MPTITENGPALAEPGLMPVMLTAIASSEFLGGACAGLWEPEALLGQGADPGMRCAGPVLIPLSIGPVDWGSLGTPSDSEPRGCWILPSVARAT